MTAIQPAVSIVTTLLPRQHEASAGPDNACMSAVEIHRLRHELEAAERKEQEWLDLAVGLARAKAPMAEVDAAWARHAQARQRVRFLLEQIRTALFVSEA